MRGRTYLRGRRCTCCTKSRKSLGVFVMCWFSFGSRFVSVLVAKEPGSHISSICDVSIGTSNEIVFV